MCNTRKGLDEYYSVEKTRTNGDNYTYYFPYCKDCNKEKTSVNRSKDIERVYELNRYYYKTRESTRESKRRTNRKMRESGKFKEWQRNNPDKLRKYSLKRQHKNHDISNDEWINCKEYFDFQCAYCGISENKAKEEQGNFLHREHFKHDGANDLSNCVPSCKLCNGHKWTYDFYEWYKRDNFYMKNFYSIDRIAKIEKWLNGDYKLFLSKNDFKGTGI